MPTLTSKTQTQPLFRLDSADEGGKCPKCQAELVSGKCATSSCSEHDDQQVVDACQKVAQDAECDGCGKKDGCQKRQGFKSKGDSVLRVDWGGNDPWSQDSDWGMTNVKPLTKTDNGSLIGRACITNVGVFTYYNADGTATHELRPEEEVMHPDSLASMALLPVTNLHPSIPVTPDNVEQFQVGSTGDGIRCDSLRVFAPVTITKQEGLEAVAAGRRGLSVGYKTLVVDTAQTYPNGKTYPCPGTWMGVRYDRIQTRIRGNHLALVDIPRAGDDAYLKMDGVGVESVKLSTNQTTHHRRADMLKIKLDGQSAEFEVAEPVKARIDSLEASEAKLTQDLVSKTTELSQAAAKVDSLTADLDKVRKDAAEALKAEKDKLDGAVTSRLALIAQATKFGVTLKGDENDVGIKRAITLAAYPDAGPKLDAMDATYAAGRFDSAVDSLEAALKNDGDQAANHQRADGADFVPGGKPADAPTTLAQKADAYTAALNKQWQEPVGSVKKPS